MKFLVKRGHEGDRAYVEGEEREARKVDVQHLSPHVLEPIGEGLPAEEPKVKKGKAEEAFANKVEPETANKAITSLKRKSE